MKTNPKSLDDISKLYFALKSAWVFPDGLPTQFIDDIRDHVNALVEDEGNGIFKIEPQNADAIRQVVKEKMKMHLN